MPRSGRDPTWLGPADIRGRDRRRRRGAPVRRFMALALYGAHGFYTGAGRAGAGGAATSSRRPRSGRCSAPCWPACSTPGGTRSAGPTRSPSSRPAPGRARSARAVLAAAPGVRRRAALRRRRGRRGAAGDAIRTASSPARELPARPIDGVVARQRAARQPAVPAGRVRRRLARGVRDRRRRRDASPRCSSAPLDPLPPCCRPGRATGPGRRSRTRPRRWVARRGRSSRRGSGRRRRLRRADDRRAGRAPVAGVAAHVPRPRARRPLPRRPGRQDVTAEVPLDQLPAPGRACAPRPVPPALGHRRARRGGPPGVGGGGGRARPRARWRCAAGSARPRRCSTRPASAAFTVARVVGAPRRSHGPAARFAASRPASRVRVLEVPEPARPRCVGRSVGGAVGRRPAGECRRLDRRSPATATTGVRGGVGRSRSRDRTRCARVLDRRVVRRHRGWLIGAPLGESSPASERDEERRPCRRRPCRADDGAGDDHVGHRGRRRPARPRTARRRRGGEPASCDGAARRSAGTARRRRSPPPPPPTRRPRRADARAVPVTTDRRSRLRLPEVPTRRHRGRRRRTSPPSPSTSPTPELAQAHDRRAAGRPPPRRRLARPVRPLCAIVALDGADRPSAGRWELDGAALVVDPTSPWRAAPGFGDCVDNDGEPLEDGAYQFTAVDAAGDARPPATFVAGAARIDQRFVNNGEEPTCAPSASPVARAATSRSTCRPVRPRSG